MKHEIKQAHAQNLGKAPPSSMTPHVHSALIKDWADGAKIQFWLENRQEWMDIDAPSWTRDKYRIKPYPDVVVEWSVKGTESRYPGTKFNTALGNNLRLTFNGFTGKLKKAEVIA